MYSSYLFLSPAREVLPAADNWIIMPKDWRMIENEDIFNKIVSLTNLNDAHFKVILDNQNHILKNQEVLYKEFKKINERLDLLEKEE